jgi:MurNAc alpha-1-phosphate uridylyltransferase
MSKPEPETSPETNRTRAMVLAAGRGERMRPLTDTCPKPLLAVRGKPLMQWPMEALAAGGFTELVVNTDWLGEQVSQRFGANPLLGHGAALSIAYSDEGRDFGGALETAGGIVRALPLLGEVFWVAAGDVFAPDFRFTQAAVERFVASGKLAHLWLVPNPAHNPKGDFGLSPDGLALNTAPGKFTFSTIGLYRAALFAPPYCDIPAGNPGGRKAPLAPILRAAMENETVSAELYTGAWTDVGTPERLGQLNQLNQPNTPR